VVSPTGRTIVDMTTLDAQARADIASRPWYVAAFRGRDTVNPQPFGTLRAGRRLVSLSWNGFRLFDEPSNMIGFGYAHLYMPWEVWKVKPLHSLRYEGTSVPDFATRQLRARRIEVLEPMPPGFEFGPNGWAVRRIVEQLAQSPPRPVTDHPDYAVGLTFLADQRGPLNRLHDSRAALAHTYLDCLASGSPTGPIGRWKHHLPADTPVFELLDAAVAGLQIPEAVALRWGLDLTPTPQEMSR
jgi:hypothetical protein